MSGEIVPLLRRLQAGDEEAFERLYAVTNPVLVRYLRVVSDADPAPLALATWATLLPDVAGFVADEDDDWFELAVGTSRTHALGAGALRSDVATAPDPSSDAPAFIGAHPDADPVDVGITTLRACGPAAGEVLAMGAIGGLGRDSIARITGREPSEVLALVLDGEAHLAQPLTGLMTTMRTPGTPSELSDLPIVLPLFDAQSHTPLPAPTRAAAAGTLTVLDLLPWDAPGPVTAQAMPPRGGAAAVVSHRWARIGAGATAWTFALGGVAAAAAMIEVVPAALHTLFGGSGSPVVTAHGPTQPSGAPQGGGGLGATPAPPGQQSVPQGPAVPRGGGPSPTGTFQSGGGVAVPASTPGVVSGTQVVVVSAVFTDTSTSTQSTSTQPTSGQSPSSAPSPPSITPPTPTPSPPSSGTGGGGASGPQAAGQTHVKHSTGNAIGRTKVTAASSAQPRAKAAHARASAAKAKAAKAAAAKAAKARAAAHAKAAKFRA